VLVVRGSRVILPRVEQPAAIYIEGGRIARIAAFDDIPPGVEVFEAGDRIVGPGLVDTHVHVNEPGRAEWEGFDTATRAAAAGGVTTIVDMPLNSIPATTTVDALYKKQRAARGQCHVDVAFWGGVVPGNELELARLVDAGVRGFKCFLAPSGVPEFPAVDEISLRRALPHLARGNARHRTLLVHAEDPGFLRAASGDSRSYATHLASRPAEAEASAIRLLARLRSEYRVTMHVVHVSSAEGVQELKAAAERGARLFAETCPHYLTFSDADVPDGAVAFKCAPPIRSVDHREALWTALAGGGSATIAMIASDHSPAPPSLKTDRDFVSAWGGIASLELSLSAVWTGASARGFDPSDVSRWMSCSPARLARLHNRKGLIRPGNDADLVVWDPDAEFVVEEKRLQQRHKLTPYAGRRLRGLVTTTFLRGRRVWDDGALVSERGGQLL
jgi:allantoinase